MNTKTKKPAQKTAQKTAQKIAMLLGLSAMAVALTGVTTQAQAGQTTRKNPAKVVKVVKITQDQFQLTLSAVPYSADPNAAYVRNACEIGKKKKPTS